VAILVQPFRELLKTPRPIVLRNSLAKKKKRKHGRRGGGKIEGREKRKVWGKKRS